MSNIYDPSVVPSANSPGRSVFKIENFKGADLSSNEVDMDPGRSPSCPNMIRSTPGKVRKRMGYYRKGIYNGRINGAWEVNGALYIHAGTKLYRNDIILAGSSAAASLTSVSDTGLTDTLSSAVVIDGTLCIFDGTTARRVSTKTIDGSTAYFCEPLSDAAYVPTVMISKNPDGTGGKFHEEVNILSDAWIESFCVTSTTATATVFQLTFGDLSNTAVVVEVLANDGVTWNAKTENTHFTVNRTLGKITMSSAPGASPVTGTDNVRIKAFKNRSSLRSRINKCTVCTSYAVSAIGARLFCGGNSELKNRDFWSAINDPTYFPDVNYSSLGRDDSMIIGYSVIDNAIAAHKDANENAIYVRTPVTDEEGYQQFKISNLVKGPGAIAPHSFAYISQEPLFLTERGIYALTVNDLTHERYSQRRSFYIDGALLKEQGLSEAHACVYKDFYVIAAGERLYILDSTTREYTPNSPYSTHQYESFYFTNIGARVIWVSSEAVHFGTDTGEVFAFYTNESSLLSYSDKGNAIAAHWQTAALQGSQFYRYKHFKRCAVQLVPYVNTGITVMSKKSGYWQTLYSGENMTGYFNFSAIDFSRLSFLSDTSPRSLNRKITIKKVDKAQLRFSNDTLNTPFGLEAVAIEYTEHGNYKGW